jgi:hypothetical protein
MQTEAVHWTTYVQTFAVIVSTIGTFLYVWFTYHIMKWAVDQGKASIEVAELTLRQEKERYTRRLRSWPRKLKVVEDGLLLWRDQYRHVTPNIFSSVSNIAVEAIQAMETVLREVIAEVPKEHEVQIWGWSLELSAIESSCKAAGRAEEEEAMVRAQAEAMKHADQLFRNVWSVQRKVIAEVMGWDPFTDDPSIGMPLLGG